MKLSRFAGTPALGGDFGNKLEDATASKRGL